MLLPPTPNTAYWPTYREYGTGFTCPRVRYPNSQPWPIPSTTTSYPQPPSPYMQPQYFPLNRSFPAVAYPVITPSEQARKQNRLKNGLLASGFAGLTTLGLYLSLQKWPRLKFWQNSALRLEDFKPPACLIPSMTEASAIQQRQALSTKIVDDIWPDILQFAQHKPPGWEKVLETKYNQALQKHLQSPQLKIFCAFLKKPGFGAVWPECFLTEDAKHFGIGNVVFDSYSTYFNPSKTSAAQSAYSHLIHETNHVLYDLATFPLMKPGIVSPKLFGDYNHGFACAHTLLQKVVPSAPQLEDLSEQQRQDFWKVLQAYWKRDDNAFLKEDTHIWQKVQETFNKYSAKDLKETMETFYLTELESFTTSLRRAPGNDGKVIDRDIKDGVRALYLRDLARAYYEHFKVPPEQQSALVKDWPFEFIPHAKA